jgi:hypothetical protein
MMKNKLRVILIMLCILLYNTTEKIVITKDAASGTVTFTLTAATPIFATPDSKPFVFYNATYTFGNSDNSKIKMPFRAKSPLIIPAPDCEAYSFFPMNRLAFFGEF